MLHHHTMVMLIVLTVSCTRCYSYHGWRSHGRPEPHVSLSKSHVWTSEPHVRSTISHVSSSEPHVRTPISHVWASKPHVWTRTSKPHVWASKPHEWSPEPHVWRPPQCPQWSLGWPPQPPP